MSNNKLLCGLCFGFSALIFLGCSGPAVMMPDNNASAINPKPGPTSWAGYKTKISGKLTLDDCIQIGLQNHSRLRIYQARIDQRSEAYNSAKVADLPVLSLSASYDRLSYVSPVKKQFLGDSNNDYQAGLNIESPIFTGGRISAEKDQAGYSLSASREDYRGAQLEVIYGVKAAYYKLMAAQEAVAVRRELLDRLNSFLDIAKGLNQQMKTPREETLLRIEVQVNSAQQELITAQTNAQILKELLFYALGAPAANQNEMQTVNLAPPGPDDFTEELDLDIRNNPEILRLDQELKRARASIDAAQGEYYPQIKLRGSYGYEWATLPPERDTWTFGLIATLPLWDWGRISSKVKQADAYMAEVNATREFTGQKVSLEAKSAYLDYLSGRQRVKIARESLDKASKSLELFEQRYKDATASSLDILDACQSYALTRLNYLQSALDARLARAGLEKLLGK